MRPQEGDPLISNERQSIYRSGVGMLLYLIKHSCPDISNAVRELTKVLDGATEAHWKAMLRVIKYVLDTKKYDLRLCPTRETDKDFKYGLEAMSDSEFSGDKETRKSVYGYIIYFCNAPVSWKSKSGNSVTLSSTEAEHYAISEATKELMFIYYLLEGMEEHNNINLPLILRVDNTGAIYLVNNHSTGPRTKHIDIRTHYVRELIDKGLLKTVFVKSENNDADIFTKNVTEELFLTNMEKNVDDSYTEDAAYILFQQHWDD